MAEVFISYARSDRNVAEHLASLLTERGWTVWWDRELCGGANFRESIQHALDDAACIIVLWSRSALASPFVVDEAEVARKRGVILPVSIDLSSPPLGFRQIHTVNWNPDRNEGGEEEILRALAQILPSGHKDAIVEEAASIDAAASIAHSLLRREPNWWPRRWVRRALAVAALATALFVGARELEKQSQDEEAEQAAIPSGLRSLLDHRALPNKEARSVKTVQDCSACPRMVSVELGSFYMGADLTQEHRAPAEKPRHLVTIDRTIYVSLTKISVEHWEACAEAGGCRPLSPSLSRERSQPVYVRFAEAIDYATWISSETGHSYRLLTEAEWEVIARQVIDRSGGPSMARDARAELLSAAKWFSPELEWVQDCWHEGYDHPGRPDDGTAWNEVDCNRRVVRGGDGSQQVPSRRSYRNPLGKHSGVGFRVVRGGI